jgi:long-chain fatty acid transport protein
LSNKSELSFFFAHAFENKVRGNNSIPAVPFDGGEADVRMNQNSLGVAYGWSL